MAGLSLFLRQLVVDAAAASAAAAALAQNTESLRCRLEGAQADADAFARDFTYNDNSAAGFASSLASGASPPQRPATKAPPAHPPCSIACPVESAGEAARAPRPPALAARASPSDSVTAVLLLALVGEMRGGDAAAEQLRDEIGCLRTEVARLKETVETQKLELDALKKV